MRKLKPVFIISGAVVGGALAYGLVGFWAWDFNPHHWDWLGRFLATVVVAIGGLCGAGGGAYIHEELDQ